MYVFKKVNWLTWSILLILLATATYFVLFSFNKDSKADENNHISPDEMALAYTNNQIENPKGSTKIQSNYPGLHLYSEHSKTDDYTIAIMYPLTGSEAIDKPIQSWAERQKKTFSENTKENKSNQSFPPHLNINVETTELQPNVYHILLHAYHYNGGANGMTYHASFTFDTEQGKLVTLEDLFHHTNDRLFIDKITDELELVIKNDELLKNDLGTDKLHDLLQDTEEWSWGVSSDAFSLYFDEYEIGPGYLGAVTLSIPLKRLDAFLKEQWGTTLSELKHQRLVEKETQIIERVTEEETEVNEEATKRSFDDFDKYIALTFDDGPQPNVTPRILETLAEYDAVATFFTLGIQVEYYPEIASLITEQGHEVASHSISHTDLTLLHKDRIKENIAQSIKIIEDTTGTKPTVFRPPFGAYDDDVLEVVEELGLSMILWSVDSLDWKNRNAKLVYSTIMSDIEVGSNILMHDIHPTTADALPDLLEALTNEGYQFVTVSELLELQKRNGSKPF